MKLERTAHGGKALARSSMLAAAAMVQMARKATIDHNRMVKNGRTQRKKE
jgi:hypothetical protein